MGAKSAVGRWEMGAKSAVLGFALSCRTQRGGNLRVDAPLSFRTLLDGFPVQSALQVEHLFKTDRRI
jgi:hypothetical protein